MSLKTVASLIVIILIAFLLRFYKVTEIPPSLNWDEVSIGYNAYSVLKTGRDEWGEMLPAHFKAYGEYKLPAQIYSSIPGIAIFGLNELGVRITPVVYGTLTILLCFFLGKILFKSDFVGLFTALFLAVSPWHIQLTRASFESSLAVFWVVMGIWLLVVGLSGKKKRWLILSMVPFAISVFTYNSARIFTPLFLLVVTLIYYKTLIRFKAAVILAAFLFAVLLLPLTPYILSGERSSRYKLVSITDDPGLIPRINERRGLSNLPDPLPRLIHNKVSYVSFYFVRNYLAHFSPDFLFISGAHHKQHHVQEIGQLYWIQAPFLLLGLYFLLKKKHPFRWLLLAWVLLIHIPVAVTNDSIPHALRTAIAAPFYSLLSAFGAYLIYQWIKHKERLLKMVLVLLALSLGIFQIFYYLNNYLNKYSINYSRDWQYGYKQVVKYTEENQEKYEQIIFSRHYGEPHMFTLFYSLFDPLKYQNDPGLIRFETYDWVRVLRFDKYYFPDLGDQGTYFEDIVAQNRNKKLLFIGKPGDFPEYLPKLKTINFLNGDPAFEIAEVN